MKAENKKMDYETAMLILKDYSDVLADNTDSYYKPMSLLSNSIEEIKDAIIINFIVRIIQKKFKIPLDKELQGYDEAMEFSFMSLAKFVEDEKVERLNDYLVFSESLENFPYPKNPSEQEKIENWKHLSSHPGHKDYAEQIQIFYKFEDELAKFKK